MRCRTHSFADLVREHRFLWKRAAHGGAVATPFQCPFSSPVVAEKAMIGEGILSDTTPHVGKTALQSIAGKAMSIEPVTARPLAQINIST